jgi:hypothetical protein
MTDSHSNFSKLFFFSPHQRADQIHQISLQKIDHDIHYNLDPSGTPRILPRVPLQFLFCLFEPGIYWKKYLRFFTAYQSTVDDDQEAFRPRTTPFHEPHTLRTPGNPVTPGQLGVPRALG